MRSLCAGLAGAVLTGVLVCCAPGCESNTTALEKVPDAGKKVDPAKDMPTLKDLADQKKAEKGK